QSNKLSWVAAILFLIMLSWQMVHFYAISIFRLEDYKAAKLPLWSIKRGINSTKKQMLLFLCLFMATNLAMSIFKYDTVSYGVLMSAVGLYWFSKYLSFNKASYSKWSKTMFFTSLQVLLIFMVLL